MRRLALIIPVLAALGGCSESIYYQTRYIPTDIESTYSVSSRAGWSGDLEAYELPAAPPDLDGTHRPRVDCVAPYQKFKTGPVARYGDPQTHSSTDIGSLTVGTTDSRVHPNGPTVGMSDPKLYATDSRPFKPGLPGAPYGPKDGMTDDRVHSINAGIDSIPVTPTAGWNNRADPNCCGDGNTGPVDTNGRPISPHR